MSGNKIKTGVWEKGERVGTWINVSERLISDVESQLDASITSGLLNKTLIS